LEWLLKCIAQTYAEKVCVALGLRFGEETEEERGGGD